MKKKDIFCFIDTIDAWKFLKKKYKNFNKIICTTSPEILLDKSIKEEKIILDQQNTAIIKSLSNDLGNLSQKVIKKLKEKGLSTNFALQYANFILGFASLLRFSTIVDDSFLQKKVIIVKNKSANPLITKALDFPIEKIFQKNKLLKIEEVIISGKKFESFLKSPNFVTRLFLNGFKNFEFLIWRKIWQFYPTNLSKGLVLLGIDGPFLRETAVFLSRRGYKFKTLPKNNKVIFGKTDINLLKKIKFFEKDFRKVLKKYLTKEVEKSVFEVFKRESKLFTQMFNHNDIFWKSYFLKNFNYSKIKCLLSTHLFDNAFLALPETLVKKEIPIFNFQHGHAREIRRQPEFDKWQTWAEPLADITFVYNIRSKIRSIIVNKVTNTKYINVGVPSVYKKNEIISKTPKHKILFISNSSYTSIRRSQLPFATSSDFRRIRFEINIIEKILKKVPYNVLYKFYPSPANLSENIVKEKIKNCRNISLIKENTNASYHYYKKRIIITYSASSTLGWALLSGLPLVFINMDFMNLTNSFKSIMSKSVFYFSYKHFTEKEVMYEDIRKFLSQPLDKIFSLWEKKKKYRKELLKKIEDENLDFAGKLASEHILKKIT